MKRLLTSLSLLVALLCLGCEDESTSPLEGSLYGVQNHAEYTKHYRLEDYSDEIYPHALGSTLIDLVISGEPFVYPGDPVPFWDKKTGKKYQRSNVPAKAKCGVSFVTQHYAITAAHCVQEAFVSEGDKFTVTTYDTTGIDADAVDEAGHVETEGFYKWPFWQQPRHLGSKDGYEVVFNKECEVVTRCDTEQGPLIGMCRLGAGDTEGFNDVDIALIYCPHREESARVEVAEYAQFEDEVEVHWFHEVVNDMPLDDPGSSDDENERWLHYTRSVSGNRQNNYHYLGDWIMTVWSKYGLPSSVSMHKQLIPLESTPWPEPHSTPRIQTSGNGKITWTDLYGCHGTSGAGIFKKNEEDALRLLGPTIRPGDSVGWNTRLCLDARESDYAPDTNQVGYAGLAYTQSLADQAYMCEGESEQFYEW